MCQTCVVLVIAVTNSTYFIQDKINFLVSPLFAFLVEIRWVELSSRDTVSRVLVSSSSSKVTEEAGTLEECQTSNRTHGVINVEGKEGVMAQTGNAREGDKT